MQHQSQLLIQICV